MFNILNLPYEKNTRVKGKVFLAFVTPIIIHTYYGCKLGGQTRAIRLLVSAAI